LDDHTRAVALALTPHIGWTLINRLLDRFGSLEGILKVSAADLQTVHGIGKVIAGYIRAVDLKRTAADLTRYQQAGITVATWLDPAYPAVLNRLDDRPLTLFWKGTITPADARAVAIVGTREASEESIVVAYEWAASMAARGWTVVSGLARGIDTAAHRGALKGRGRSLAILGSGVEAIYPSSNADLAQKLIASGAVISEFAPDSPPSPAQLAFRNRLIAAFSRAVIVVEAGLTSGAIYAAESAHDHGSPVFALPNSAGNAAMLAQYARPLPPDAETLIAAIKGK